MAIAVFYTLLVLGELIAAGLLRGAEGPLYDVCGKDTKKHECGAKGSWGAAFCSLTFLIFWACMNYIGLVETGTFYACALLGSLYGFTVFWVLEQFAFPEKDVGKRALYASLAVGAPCLIMGFISVKPAYAAISLVLGGLAGLIASYVIAEWRNIGEPDNKALVCLGTLGASIGAVIGTAIGASERYLAAHYEYDPTDSRVGVAVGGGVAGAIIGFFSYAFLAAACYIISLAVAKSFGPLYRRYLIITRHSKIICGTCYLYTHPLKCRYDQGTRYCENCNSEVERTREVGVVAFVYGDFPPQRGGRMFVFRNHDCENAPFKADVSFLLVDCRTADVDLLYKFITYVHQYSPPSGGARSITVLYRGDLGKLGANAANLLFNNFDTVKEFLDWREVVGRGFTQVAR